MKREDSLTGLVVTHYILLLDSLKKLSQSEFYCSLSTMGGWVPTTCKCKTYEKKSDLPITTLPPPAVPEPLNLNEYVCASPAGPGGAHLSVTVQTVHKAPAGSDLSYNSSHGAVTEGPFTGR